MEDGEWFNAIEFAIVARDGGTSLLRYAHSGIFVGDWETQYDAVEQHTDFYLHTLSEYLEHFSGRAAAYIGQVRGGIQGPAGSATPGGFTRLQHELGLGEQAEERETVERTAEGLEPVRGVIDYRRPNCFGVRSDNALYRFFGRNAFGGPVGMSIHAFGNGIDPDKLKRDWQQYLNAALA